MTEYERLKAQKDAIVKREHDKIYNAAIEAAAGVLRSWAAHYPTDIFPEDGASVDCRSAAFARHLCREIEKDVRALGAGDSQT